MSEPDRTAHRAPWAPPDCHCPHLEQWLETINTKLEFIMAAQDDINAAVAEDTALLADLTTQAQAIGAAQAAFATEIANLQSQGVDTSGLVAANEQLAAAQAPLDAAVAALTAASAPPAPAGS